MANGPTGQWNFKNHGRTYGCEFYKSDVPMSQWSARKYISPTRCAREIQTILTKNGDMVGTKIRALQALHK